METGFQTHFSGPVTYSRGNGLQQPGFCQRLSQSADDKVVEQFAASGVPRARTEQRVMNKLSTNHRYDWEPDRQGAFHALLRASGGGNEGRGGGTYSFGG